MHRVNVNFSDAAYDTLKRLSTERGKTMAEVLRDAIALERWFWDARKEGERILVEKNGNVKEIIPR